MATTHDGKRGPDVAISRETLQTLDDWARLRPELLRIAFILDELEKKVFIHEVALQSCSDGARLLSTAAFDNWLSRLFLAPRSGHNRRGGRGAGDSRLGEAVGGLS